MTTDDIVARRARDLERYHSAPPSAVRRACASSAESARPRRIAVSASRAPRSAGPPDLARHHRRTAERADQGLCRSAGSGLPRPSGPCAGRAEPSATGPAAPATRGSRRAGAASRRLAGPRSAAGRTCRRSAVRTPAVDARPAPTTICIAAPVPGRFVPVERQQPLACVGEPLSRRLERAQLAVDDSRIERSAHT